MHSGISWQTHDQNVPWNTLSSSEMLIQGLEVYIRAYKICFIKVKKIYWSICSQTIKGDAECLSFLKKDPS